MLTVAECEAMIAAARPNLEPATIDNGGVEIVAKAVRHSEAWKVPPGSPTWDRLAELAEFTEARIVHYGIEGHFGWHTDGDRELTVVLLVDPGSYVGGVLEVGNPGREYPMPLEQGVPKQVPARLRHRITPIVAGERWAAVMWTEGVR